LLLLVAEPAAARAAGSSGTAPSRDPDSVYDVSLWTDGAIIVAGGGVALGLYAFGSGLIHPSCPCDPQTVNGFDRPTIGNHDDFAYQLATTTVGLTLLGPVVLDALDLRRARPVFEDTVVFAEAIAISGGLVTATKYAVQRPFPRTYAGQPDILNNDSGYRSFYSGHTALTFTALGVTSMTVGRRYGHWALPWIATVVIGASVAAELVLAGWHFPTDVITGAALGTASGVIVPVTHFTALPVRPVVSVMPGGGPGVSLVGAWR
jgi:membrane-associated phospholipid phosphatase